MTRVINILKKDNVFIKDIFLKIQEQVLVSNGLVKTLSKVIGKME
jgi:hypothetical protein